MVILSFFIIMTQQINMSTQQMLICRNNQVCLHGIFAYENINVMTFTFIFGHYANKQFLERIPQFHAEYRYGHCMLEWSIQWLTLYITDATFDSLDFTMLMWFFQFNDSSIKTPRNLVA